MREVLLQYRSAVTATSGRLFAARACGAPARDGTNRWHGWVEFLAADGSVLRTPPETIQPDRDCTLYWSTGITAVYLQGAFQRARRAAEQ